MSDILEVLRAAANHPSNQHGPNAWLVEAADTIAALTARVEELERALKAWDEAVMADITMEGPVFITVSRRLGRKAWELTRAALTKGERTPSFGDFVEGCDYLPVPSTKGESHD